MIFSYSWIVIITEVITINASGMMVLSQTAVPCATPYYNNCLSPPFFKSSAIFGVSNVMTTLAELMASAISLS